MNPKVLEQLTGMFKDIVCLQSTVKSILTHVPHSNAVLIAFYYNVVTEETGFVYVWIWMMNSIEIAATLSAIPVADNSNLSTHDKFLGCVKRLKFPNQYPVCFIGRLR